ncbi:hypothetical protein ACAG24_004960 [Mycobacterium sp. pW049]|uniref:hypothetical protein n=1 Tax=[Mycobacterium] bulgaricum TaxID=3238985 RepID=UPI00351B63BB
MTVPGGRGANNDADVQLSAARRGNLGGDSAANACGWASRGRQWYRTAHGLNGYSNPSLSSPELCDGREMPVASPALRAAAVAAQGFAGTVKQVCARSPDYPQNDEFTFAQIGF